MAAESGAIRRVRIANARSRYGSRRRMWYPTTLR